MLTARLNISNHTLKFAALRQRARRSALDDRIDEVFSKAPDVAHGLSLVMRDPKLGRASRMIIENALGYDLSFEFYGEGHRSVFNERSFAYDGTCTTLNRRWIGVPDLASDHWHWQPPSAGTRYIIGLKAGLNPARSLSVVFHELAHTVFEQLFEEALPTLAEDGRFVRWSEKLGCYLVALQFFSFLTERFACERQAELERALSFRGMLPTMFPMSTPHNQDRHVADFVWSTYSLSDEKVLGLRQTPVLEILKGYTARNRVPSRLPNGMQEHQSVGFA